MKNTLFW